MKKVIIQGFRTPKMESNNPTIRNLENQEIIDYVNSIHEAEEIFIFAHGSEYQLKENLSIMFKVSLYNISNNKYEKEDLNNEFVQNLLTNINKNTTNNLPNIFHFYSCHSGAIHNYLSEVKGSLVLCTYIPSDGIALNRVNEILYNRSIESINLIDFIVKNLPLLAVVGFKISYKFNDEIVSFAFNPEEIINLDLNFYSTFLEEQYKKICDMYKYLFKKYGYKYSEIFPDYKLTEVKTYYTDELKEAFSHLLNLNINKLTRDNVEHFLKIEGLDVKIALLKLIEKQNLEMLNLIKNYQGIKFDSSILSSAIYTKNLEIIKLVINKLYRISSRELDLVNKFGNKELIKLIYSKISIDEPVIEKAHNTCDLKIINSVLNKKNHIEKSFESDKTISEDSTDNYLVHTLGEI